MISFKTKERIYELFLDGHTQESIAKFYKVSQSTISNIIKEMRLITENNGLKQNMFELAKIGVKAIGNTAKAASKLIDQK